jgi:hypothetical protein
MWRASTPGVAGLVGALVLAVGAQAEHDRATPFAGSWAIGARGDQGQIALSRLSDAAGQAVVASFGGTLACVEPTDYYQGRLATPTGGGPLVGCTSTRGATDRLDGLYLDEALASAGPPAELDILIRHLASRPRATAFWTTSAAPASVREAPLTFRGHLTGDGARVEPMVTLRRLRVTGERARGGATATITGTFRGRAVAGRRTHRLLPVGGALATYRPGTAPAQRARVAELFLDGRSGSEYLRVVGTGSVIGGPVIARSGGACRRVAFRYTVRPASGTATLRWACRSRADRSPPVALDVFRRPRDRIASSYTIIRRPCSPSVAGTAKSHSDCGATGTQRRR